MKLLASRFSRDLQQFAQAGWLDDLTNWQNKIVHQWWDAFVRFCGDMILKTLRQMMELSVYIVNHLPVPDFLTAHSIGEYLGNAGPTIGWLASEMRLAEAMALIAAAFVFRVSRKILTFGRW